MQSFKEINDQDGLQAGDECLRAVAESVRDSLPPEATAFRYGGDEFVVLLPGHDLASARESIEGIRAAVASQCRPSDRPPLGTRWGLGELRKGMALTDALAAADLELLEQHRSAAGRGNADAGPGERRGTDRARFSGSN